MFWKKILGFVIAILFIAIVVQAQSSNVVIDARSHHVIHLTNITDGTTDEIMVQKVNRSALTARDGDEPAALDLDQIEWNIQGYTYISLLWDQPTTDDQMVLLNGSGYKDFRGQDKGVFGVKRTSGLQDPRDALGTGDIIMTTNGATADGTYDITIWLHKAAD